MNFQVEENHQENYFKHFIIVRLSEFYLPYARFSHRRAQQLIWAGKSSLLGIEATYPDTSRVLLIRIISDRTHIHAMNETLIINLSKALTAADKIFSYHKIKFPSQLDVFPDSPFSTRTSRSVFLSPCWLCYFISFVHIFHFPSTQWSSAVPFFLILDISFFAKLESRATSNSQISKEFIQIFKSFGISLSHRVFVVDDKINKRILPMWNVKDYNFLISTKVDDDEEWSRKGFLVTFFLF